MKQLPRIAYNPVAIRFELHNGRMLDTVPTHPAYWLAWRAAQRQPALVSRLWRAAALVVDERVMLHAQQFGIRPGDRHQLAEVIGGEERPYLVMVSWPDWDPEPGTHCMFWQEGNASSNFTGAFQTCPDCIYRSPRHALCKHQLAALMAVKLAGGTWEIATAAPSPDVGLRGREIAARQHARARGRERQRVRNDPQQWNAICRRAGDTPQGY